MASMAEWQALRNAVFVGRMHRAHTAQVSAPLGALGLAQVPPAGAGAQHFAASRNLEPLGRGLLRFNAFWTSHKSIHFLSKRARNICPREGGYDFRVHISGWI
jgi:hypothetical protein